jgi:Mg-chelatase subunit ChlD
MNQPDDRQTRQVRWRLILEAGTESILGQTPDGLWQQRADALTFLYDREYGSRNVRPGSGSSSGKGASSGQGQGTSGGSGRPTQVNPGQSSNPPSQGSGANRSHSQTQGTQKQGQGSEPEMGCTGAGQGGVSANEQGEANGAEQGAGGADNLNSGGGSAQDGGGSQSGDSSGLPSLDRHGGLGPSQLTVPEWINAIYELFPKKTIERLEKDALERYNLEEMVTNPDLLSRAEPSQTLLKAVLRTKHLMNQDVLAMARLLVQRAIAELMEQLAREIQSPFLGAINRQRRSWLKVAKNFDAETTIRQNLSTYDPETKRLYIKTPYFHSRIRRQMDRWQIVIVVDESGSMMDSVIHAAVTASIFYSLKHVKTHLCIFDTAVVDLTEQCSDPVETLMQVQLGGGTDIGQALAYAESLVENPRNTIIILITDFYEGVPWERLLGVTRSLIESGVTLLGLAALDSQANPNYNRDLAQRMVNLGAHVGAMTPGELAVWVAEKVR